MSASPFPNAPLVARRIARAKEEDEEKTNTITASDEYEMLRGRIQSAIEHWDQGDFDCTFFVISSPLALDAMMLIASQLEESGWQTEVRIKPVFCGESQIRVRKTLDQ